MLAVALCWKGIERPLLERCRVVTYGTGHVFSLDGSLYFHLHLQSPSNKRNVPGTFHAFIKADFASAWFKLFEGHILKENLQLQ